jgi:hypothetical protein
MRRWYRHSQNLPQASAAAEDAGAGQQRGEDFRRAGKKIEVGMNNKISLFKDDLLAALIFILFMLGAPLLVLSLERGAP